MDVSTYISAEGLGLAFDNLDLILKNAFTAETKKGHDLQSMLRSSGMLCVRYRNPTNGARQPH